MEHSMRDHSHGAGGHDRQLDFLIVSARLTIEAIRDSGYKDTDHALAEIIDNSVEAGAELIEVIAVEVPPEPGVKYARARINQIAVADDGEGMDAVTLRRALKFGDGTRKDRSKRGIGRFGVGLPQSSVSQCRRVDVWTWQNGADNAYHCYLDLDDIQTEGTQDVPEPTVTRVPDRWRKVAANIGEATGTLVVWSSLDRVRWSGGGKTLDRTGELCGRIYRKFLTDDAAPVTISLTLTSARPEGIVVKYRHECKANDPLYLTAPSSTPEPFCDRSMFMLFNERKWSIGVDGVVGTIHVRCTMARPEAINERRASFPWPKSFSNPGDSPWGKHAARNKGVSITRARRELELSLAWVNNYEPTERWWSVEVEFDPILDEIFGVVNNKQHAHAFVSGAGFDWKDAADAGESFGAFCERLEETSDSRAHLIQVWNWIDDQIVRMRKERKKLMKGVRAKGRHPETGEDVEDVATKIINEQKEQGETGESDKAPETTKEYKIHQITESAKQVKVGQDTAQEWAEETVHSGRRVLIKAVTLGHRDAFFDVESVSDVIEIWVNDQHPVHEHLIEVVGAEVGGASPEELVERLDKAAFTLRMLLIAWARHEDKAPAGMKETLEDARMDWGREARKFLSVIDS